MMVDSHFDSRFYEATPPDSLGERITVTARDRIYRDFLHYCAPRPGNSILDVGVSDVVNAAANVLERCYPRPEDITAAGLGGGGGFRRTFPRTRYVQIAPHRPLPFRDRAFRFAASNAVLEHVGSRPDKEMFVQELLRVSEEVFITVPNRFFRFFR